MVRTSLCALLACIACGGGASSGDGTPMPGLQYSGMIATSSQLELSAPIVPDSVIWQYQGGSRYPATLADAAALVRDTTYTYEFLLAACAPAYPTIAVASPGQKLTEAQLEANYDQVARCAYEKHGAKPYWMPQILDDVDVCALKLGSGWRLPTEADLARFSEADFQLFKDTMTIGASGTDMFPRQFYFSLDIYVRGSDGALKWGDLTPGATHVGPLPVSDAELKDHYLGNGRPISVRCLRATP
jgi:hypothetical protein